MFVFCFLLVAYFLARPNLPRFHRQRGFSNRARAAIFVVTIINFLLCSLKTGTQVALFIVFIQKAITPDIGHPLASQNLKVVIYWSETLPVSSNLSLLDSEVSIHAL